MNQTKEVGWKSDAFQNEGNKPMMQRDVVQMVDSTIN